MASQFIQGLLAPSEIEGRQADIQHKRSVVEMEQAKRTDSAIDSVITSAAKFSDAYQKGMLGNITREQYQQGISQFLNTGLRTSQLAVQSGRNIQNTPELVQTRLSSLMNVPDPSETAVSLGTVESTKRGARADVAAQRGIPVSEAEIAAGLRPKPPSAAVNINMGERTIDKEMGKELVANFSKLRNSANVLDNIEKAKAAIPKAASFMGTGGETLLAAAKFMNNRLGTNVDTEGVKSVEELRSRIFFQVLENLRKLDAQPSQQQQQVMQDALGRIGTDPNALPAILDAYGDVVRMKVGEHNDTVNQARSGGVKFMIDPTIKIPKHLSEFRAGGVQTVNPSSTQTAVNPTTGEKLILVNGQWQQAK